MYIRIDICMSISICVYMREAPKEDADGDEDAMGGSSQVARALSFWNQSPPILEPCFREDSRPLILDSRPLALEP